MTLSVGYTKNPISNEIGFSVFGYFRPISGLFGYPCVMWHFLYFFY